MKKKKKLSFIDRFTAFHFYNLKRCIYSKLWKSDMKVAFFLLLFFNRLLVAPNLARFLILSCQHQFLQLQSFYEASKKNLQLEAKNHKNKSRYFRDTNTYSLLRVTNQFCCMQIIFVNTGRTWISISVKWNKHFNHTKKK